MSETSKTRTTSQVNPAGRSCVLTVDGQSYELATKSGQNAYLRGLTLRLNRLPSLPVEVTGRKKDARDMAAKQLEAMRAKIHKLQATLETREISADEFKIHADILEDALNHVAKYAKGVK